MLAELIGKVVIANESTSHFLYGLVFFISGIGILVQYKSEHIHPISKEIWLLGLFALMHALVEWIDLFIPLQAVYLSGKTLFFLHVFLMIFAALAFVALFVFGLRLIFPRPTIFQRVIPLLFFIPWLIISVIVMVQGRFNTVNFMNDLSRYMLYFPASTATAIGLFWQAKHVKKTPYFASIRKTLRALAFTFMFYAFFSGLVIGSEPFFPASVFNSDQFYRLTHISVKVFRAFCGTGIMVFTIRLIVVLNKESSRILLDMKLANSRLEEREHIAQDIHDGVLQTLYATGLMLESTVRQLDPASTLKDRLETCMSSLNASMIDLRNYISGSPKQASIKSPTLDTALLALIKEFQQNYQINVQYRNETDISLKLSPIRQDHFSHIVRELFNNVVKHARANQVIVTVQTEGEKIVVTFSDNGIGFAEAVLQTGRQKGLGLKHIHKRIAKLQGKINFSFPDQGGTTVKIMIPAEVEKNVHSIITG